MLHFTANIEASFLYTVVAARPMPPVAAKTKGEKQPLESIHHVLGISPPHGHDNVWTMEGYNRSAQKS